MLVPLLVLCGVVCVVWYAGKRAVGVTGRDLNFCDVFGAYRIDGCEDRNANVDAVGKRIDVDAASRKAHGYAAPVVLPRGAVAVAPTVRRCDVAVILGSGLGRSSDDFDLAGEWRARGMDAVFLDVRRYGRAFRAAAPVVADGDRYNYTADLREYGDDFEDALDYAANRLGYGRFVLCSCSTGGLALVDWCVRIGDAGLKARNVGAVLLAAPALKLNSEALPRPADRIVLALCRALRRIAPAAYAALGRSVVLARDAELGGRPAVADGPSWLDAVVSERARTYDRYLNPCRGKPTFLGYVVALLEAQDRVAAAAPGGLAVPALCFTPRYDRTSPDRPPGVEAVPGGKIDEHLDVAEVERVFSRVFANGTFARIDAQHEVLASARAVALSVLDACEEALSSPAPRD